MVCTLMDVCKFSYEPYFSLVPQILLLFYLDPMEYWYLIEYFVDPTHHYEAPINPYLILMIQDLNYNGKVQNFKTTNIVEYFKNLPQGFNTILNKLFNSMCS